MHLKTCHKGYALYVVYADVLLFGLHTYWQSAFQQDPDIVPAKLL